MLEIEKAIQILRYIAENIPEDGRWVSPLLPQGIPLTPASIGRKLAKEYEALLACSESKNRGDLERLIEFLNRKGWIQYKGERGHFKVYSITAEGVMRLEQQGFSSTFV